MNTIIPAWQSSVSVIIFHPIEARILMLPNERDWVLPSIQLKGRLWVQNAIEITQELRRKWGIDTTVLYSPDFQVDETISHQVHALYVIENHRPTWIPPLGGQWIGRSALAKYAPQLKAMCEQLAGYRVPQMLVHGDLHTGDIAGQQGKLIFFDWSDGCISHPFFDLLAFWGNLDVLTEVPEARMRLQNAYLAQWTAYEPMERLREAAALAEKLAAVHHAVSYQHLLANLEGTTRKQLRTGLLFLRALL